MARVTAPDWRTGTVMLGIWRLSRWFVIAFCGTGCLGFLIWLGVSVAADRELSAHGETVVATVEQTTLHDRDQQYLLAFTMDGQPDEQWTADVPSLKRGDTVSVLVDTRDHTRIESVAEYGRRWGGYAIQLVAGVALGLLCAGFLRGDVEDYRSAALARYRY
jgi:hypothetical protein